MPNLMEEARETPLSENGPTGLISRTLGILEILSAHGKGLSLSAVADNLGIPRSATHRVLSGLLANGYVRQDAQGDYQLTARIASLAFSFLASSGIVDLAQPVLDRLAADSQELARLALVDGQQLVWVAKAQGAPFGLRYDADMGEITRLSCSASGHAWLACLPDSEALALVERQGFGMPDDYGENAARDSASLLTALNQTRARGYSLALQSYRPWVNGIAVPVRRGVGGDVAGTVVVTGPSMRLTEARLTELAPALLEAAHDLTLICAGVAHSTEWRNGGIRGITGDNPFAASKR